MILTPKQSWALATDNPMLKSTVVNTPGSKPRYLSLTNEESGKESRLDSLKIPNLEAD